LSIPGAGAGANSPRSWAETATLASIAMTTAAAANNFIAANAIVQNRVSRHENKPFQEIY
jgi:hypothetical protein